MCVYLYEYVTKGKKSENIPDEKKIPVVLSVPASSTSVYSCCSPIFLVEGGLENFPGKIFSLRNIEYHATSSPRLDWFSSEGLGFFGQELLWVH